MISSQTPQKPCKKEVFPKSNTPYRIKIKEFFLQPRNETLIMANYSHNPVQEWYFKKIQQTQNEYKIVNVATGDIICAPWLNEGKWSHLKTRQDHSKFNYRFRFNPSELGKGKEYHIVSNVEGQERIWDARNGQAYQDNTILNWDYHHHEWNQTFTILEINAEHQLALSDFIRAQRLCAVCLFNEANMINTVCMHVSACQKCSNNTGDRCVICRCPGNLRKIIFC